MPHWTDNRIKERDGKFVIFDDIKEDYVTFENKEDARDRLIAQSIVHGNTEAYKLGWLLAAMLRKLMELRLRYFVSADGTVLTYWNGGWSPYHEVAEIDTRMKVW